MWCVELCALLSLLPWIPTSTRWPPQNSSLYSYSILSTPLIPVNGVVPSAHAILEALGKARIESIGLEFHLAWGGGGGGGGGGG